MLCRHLEDAQARCREFGGLAEDTVQVGVGSGPWHTQPHPALLCAPHSGSLRPFPAEQLPPQITSVSPHRSGNFRSQWLGQLHFLFSFQRGISLGGPLKELRLHLHLWVMGLAWLTAEPRGGSGDWQPRW